MTVYHRTANSVDGLIATADRALRDGRPDLAAQAANAATERAPERLEAWWLWSLAAMSRSAFGEAEDILLRALEHIPAGHPLRPRFLVQRVRALIPHGRDREACELAREALALGIDDAETLLFLSMALRLAGRESEALPLLEQAVALAPQSPQAWHALGELQQFLGVFAAAEASYERAATLAPNADSYYALAGLRRWTREHNHIAALKALPVSQPAGQAKRAYALFKELEDLGDYDEAWTWLAAGANAARRQPVAFNTVVWSKEAEAATVAAWKRHFPAGRFAGLIRPEGRPRRIFIVGLPRSGTTLVERILAAHSHVRALGELQTFAVAVKRLTATGGAGLLEAEVIAAAAQRPAHDFAEVYNRETAHLSSDDGSTIDKLPYNHECVGLIRLAFPDAAIIHVRRNPMDSLFGAYKLYVSDNYRWSFDQDDLADHYAAYRDLMDHWRTCLGDGLVEVSLEALIADPEVQIRRLVAACRLPFEDACLSPHTATGAVATASSVQVRQPINAGGVGAWRRYAAHLEPLKRRLVAMGAVDSDGNAL
ncbi:MAG: sulfotransferase [Asticcacaulis sp.]|nr:sulfotransferase [Asticcacaulis sp.]